MVPEFIVEIVSPSDSLSKQVAKMQEYVANGVLLGWLVIPMSREVQVYRQGLREAESVLEADSITADESVLPGFVLDLRLIW